MKSFINISGKAVSLPQVTKRWLIFIEILLIAGWWLLGASESFGQIAPRGIVTNGNTTGGTLTIDKPEDLEVGDIMFANIALYGADMALNNPFSTGWTLIDGNDVGGREELRSELLYRLTTATDAGPEVTNYSFTLSTSEDSIIAAVGTICTFPGVDIIGGVLTWGGAGGQFDVIAEAISGIVSSTTITLLDPGTYNFALPNDRGVMSPASASVDIDATSEPPSAPVVTVTQPTCTTATGTISVTVQNAGDTYSFDNGATFQAGNSRPGLAAGTYIVIIRSVSGFNSTGTMAIINPPVSTPETPVQSIDCTPGIGNATVTVISPAGTGLEYSLDGSTYQTGMIFTGISNGSHTITVSNSDGCTSTGPSFTVSCGCTDGPTLVLNSISGSTCGTTPVGVNGNTFTNATLVTLTEDGAGSVTPTTTGSASFDFTYTPGSGDAGNTVTITITTDNPLGTPCAEAVATYTLTVNDIPSPPSADTITQPTCADRTGRVVLSALPSTGTWTINPGGITGAGTSTTITGLDPGNYNFTVTDDAGCTSGVTTVIINSPPATPSAPAVGAITQPTCTVSGGSVVLNGLPASGTWTIEPGRQTGTGTSATITGLAPGTYNYTVTNAAGCISSASSNVVINTAPGAPSAPVIGTIVHPTCVLATGSVTLSGLPAGSWTINPGAVTGTDTTSTISNLIPGNYTFTVAIASGCTSLPSATVVIDVPAVPAAPLIGAITQPTCTASTGSVILSGLPATGTWTINPGGFNGQGENVTISGLSSGSYNFTVITETGCISPASAGVVINAISGSPSAPVVTLTQPTCTTATGTISVTVQNAGDTYSFDNGATFQAGNSRPGLAAGTYNVIIRSVSGCNSTGTTAIINPPVSTPEAPVQSVDCTPGIGNATVTVISPAGTGLEYSLDGGTYQTGILFTGIANGSHTITVRNSTSGCTATGTSFTVSCECPDPPTLVLSRVSGGTCGITPITVSGNTFINATNITVTENGAGTVSTTDPNTSPFAFAYTPAAGDAGNTVVITINTDNPTGSPCAAATATFTLSVNALPAAPTPGAITQPVTCVAASRSVVLNGLPATGTWTVNPGAVTGTGASTTITGLTGGTYNFTVTNEAGCTSRATGDIVINSAPSAPEAPTVSVTDPTCTVNTGTITVTSSTTGLTFSLDGAPFTAYPPQGYTLVAAGSHTLTAQNVSNCISAITRITLNAQPSIKDNYTKEFSDFNGYNISCYGKTDGFININSSGTSTPFAFSWNGPGGFTASTEDISGLTAGEYTVLITDKNLCTARDTFMLTEPTRLSMTFDLSISTDGAYNISCAGESTGSIYVSVPEYVGFVNYLWSDGQTGNQRTDLSAGTYDIIITDQNNCKLNSSAVLTEPDPIKPAFDITQPSCPDNTDGEIRLTVSGGVPGTDYNYLWSDNSTNKDLSNIPAGAYEVTISDANVCSSRSSITLELSQEACLVMNEALSPNGDLINDVWNIGNKSSYPEMEVTIYNRWGQSVWKSGRGYPIPWDGKSNGSDLPVDSYHYVIDLHNGSKPIVGDITIVR